MKMVNLKLVVTGKNRGSELSLRELKKGPIGFVLKRSVRALLSTQSNPFPYFPFKPGYVYDQRICVRFDTVVEGEGMERFSD